jgi:drug/metabolite transporter (DMT)-like permease
MASRSDYFKLHFIVFLWGFSAILGMLVTIPPMEMVFYRAILAAIGMAIVIQFTGGTFRVSSRQLVQLILIGFVVALHWVAFFASARVSNVSVSLVGFATNSLWTAVLVPWFSRTGVKKFELLLGLVVLSGLYIIFSFDFHYRLGLFLAVLAGLTSALFSIFNARLVRDIPAYTITFYEMAGIFIGLGLFMPIYRVTWAPDQTLHLIPKAMDWVYIGLLAGVCSVYAYSTAVELMKRISVFLIQLSLNLEPVYGIIMAVIIFGDRERMGANFYVGTVIILSAVLLYPVVKRKFERQPNIAGTGE